MRVKNAIVKPSSPSRVLAWCHIPSVLNFFSLGQALAGHFSNTWFTLVNPASRIHWAYLLGLSRSWPMRREASSISSDHWYTVCSLVSVLSSFPTGKVRSCSSNQPPGFRLLKECHQLNGNSYDAENYVLVGLTSHLLFFDGAVKLSRMNEVKFLPKHPLFVWIIDQEW